jgi:hypothetical protein
VEQGFQRLQLLLVELVVQAVMAAVAVAVVEQ